MLTLHPLRAPTALLLLDLDAHRLGFHPHHHRAAGEEPLVHKRRALEREVPAAEDRGLVQTQNVAGLYPLQEEGKAEDVAFGDQEGTPVDVDADVVAWLGGEGGEEGADRGGEGAGLLRFGLGLWLLWLGGERRRRLLGDTGFDVLGCLVEEA